MHIAFGIQRLASAIAGATVVLCGIALRRMRRASRAGNVPAAPAPATPEDVLHTPGAVALVGHELRTPLATLTGVLDLVARSRTLPEEARRSLLRAQDAAATMRTLLDDLLEMARPGAERFVLRPSSTDIRALLWEIADTFSSMARARGLRICWSDGASPEADPGIRHRADPVRVRQILANVLANAIAHSTRHPIAVRSELHRIDGARDRLTVQVSDRGPGIDPEDMSRLFQPFARGRRNARAGGTGLGLYIARSLARRMSGDVSLDSSPGAGTTATVTLTLQRMPPPPGSAARTPRNALPASLAGTQALVIDDHPAGRALLVSQLQHLGVACLAAANADEAIALWQRSAPDIQVLVTDCMLPDMDGFAMTRRIRMLENACANGRRLPILGYSADGRPGQARRAAAAGMDVYLVKPVNIDMLGAALHRLLRAACPRLPAARRAGSGDVGSSFDEPRVVETLLSANRADLAALVQAAHEGDIGLAQTIVHRLRGVASLAGAAAVARHCALLATACEAQDIRAVRACLPALVHAVDYWDRTLRIRRDGTIGSPSGVAGMQPPASANPPTSSHPLDR